MNEIPVFQAFARGLARSRHCSAAQLRRSYAVRRGEAAQRERENTTPPYSPPEAKPRAGKCTSGRSRENPGTSGRWTPCCSTADRQFSPVTSDRDRFSAAWPSWRERDGGSSVANLYEVDLIWKLTAILLLLPLLACTVKGTQPPSSPDTATGGGRRQEIIRTLTPLATAELANQAPISGRVMARQVQWVGDWVTWVEFSCVGHVRAADGSEILYPVSVRFHWDESKHIWTAAEIEEGKWSMETVTRLFPRTGKWCTNHRMTEDMLKNRKVWTGKRPRRPPIAFAEVVIKSHNRSWTSAQVFPAVGLDCPQGQILQYQLEYQTG